MLRAYHLNKDGSVTLIPDAGAIEEHCRAMCVEFENPRRILAHDDVVISGETVRVSTVFLVYDHSFRDEGVPVLFETMVFKGPLDQEQLRYSSYAAAMKGHANMLARVREFTDIPTP